MYGKRSNPDRPPSATENPRRDGGFGRVDRGVPGCQFRPVMRIALRVAAALMAIFFVYAAVVQLNDPDPVRWIAISAAATRRAIRITGRN